MNTAIIIFLLTVASFLLGLTRDLAIAKYFGASWVSDALFLALVVPVFFENILGIALRDALIPHLKTVQSHHLPSYEGEVNRLGGLVLFASSGILLLFLAAPKFWVGIMAPGWGDAQVGLATELFAVGTILVFVHAWGYFQAGILNSEDVFVLPMWRPIMFNVGALAGILLYPGHIASVLIGMIVLLVCHSIWMQAKLGARGLQGSAFYPREFFTSRVAFLKGFLPVLAGTAALQVIVISERVFSSWLQPGSLSALSYAYRLTTVPLVLFSVSSLTLIFPLLVAHHLDESDDGFRVVLVKGLKATLLILVPAAIFLHVFAEPITSLLFEHGVFRAREREMTAAAVGAYAMGLPFLGLALLGSRAVLALGKSRLLLKAALLGMTATIAAQALSYKALNTMGLAAAVSLGGALQAFVLWRDILRLVPVPGFWLTLTRWFVAALIIIAILPLWPWSNVLGLIAAGVGMLVSLLAFLWFLGERKFVSRDLFRLEVPWAKPTGC